LIPPTKRRRGARLCEVVNQGTGKELGAPKFIKNESFFKKFTE